MKLKSAGRICAAAAGLLAVFFLPGRAYAQTLGGIGYQNNGAESGLTVTAAETPEIIDNLNPGDGKRSSLLLSNTGQNSLRVYVQTRIDGETAPGGGRLSDVMRLTIRDRNEVLESGKTFRAAGNRGPVLVGQMEPGARKTLDFYTDLPGEETGNSYQGASMRVHWIFTAVNTGKPGSSGDEIPTAVDAATDTNPDPSGPKTGERMLYTAAALGLVLAAAGIWLLRRNAMNRSGR